MAAVVRRDNSSRSRLTIFFLIVTLCYVALIGRLVYLQIVNGASWRKQADDMRAQNIVLRAQRGVIYDRNGKPLAISTHYGRLVCDPTQIPEKNREQTATEVANLFGLRASDVLPRLMPRLNSRHVSDRNVVLCDQITPESVMAYKSAKKNKAIRPFLAGINVVDKQVRTYPVGKDAVHLVGFLSIRPNGDNSGALGLEQKLDKVLAGRNGELKAEVDAGRRIIPDTQQKLVDAHDGMDVRLTLDTAIQHITATELAACTKKYRPLSATAIVMDPSTGDILAMVSYPSFDPVKREGLSKSLSPLANRALIPFEPGSTMKIITAATAIDDRAITPTTPFFCNGRYKTGKRTVNCVLHGASQAHGHGNETVRDIIMHSCNVGTAQIGAILGMDRMESGLNAFGLLEKSHIGLPGDTAGTLGDVTDRGLTKVTRVAFGQSVMVTPLAMASAYAAIANGGKLMKPRLVGAYAGPEGEIMEEFKPELVRQAVSPQTAAYMRQYLAAVVTSGTGKAAAVPGYTVAGKTGTAQKAVKGIRGYASGKYVASFVGFLPVSAPRAVVYVVVDEPQGAYYGAQVAAPVFQSISRQLMLYWRVPPDAPTTLPHSAVASAPR